MIDCAHNSIIHTGVFNDSGIIRLAEHWRCKKCGLDFYPAAERQRQEAEAFRWLEENRASFEWWYVTSPLRKNHWYFRRKISGESYEGDTLLAAILSARQEARK